MQRNKQLGDKRVRKGWFENLRAVIALAYEYYLSKGGKPLPLPPLPAPLKALIAKVSP